MYTAFRNVGKNRRNFIWLSVFATSKSPNLSVFATSQVGNRILLVGFCDKWNQPYYLLKAFIYHGLRGF